MGHERTLPSVRVLFVFHQPVFGGPMNQLVRLRPALMEHGVEASAVLSDEPGNGASRLADAGVPTDLIPLGRVRASASPRVWARTVGGLRADVGRIARIVQRDRIDVVELHGLLNPHGAIAARRAGAAVVWQLIDTRAPVPARLAMGPVVARLADVVMTTGRSVADMHSGLGGLGERLVPYVPPVDTTLFRPDPQQRRQARAELGVGADELLVGAVGNVNRQKGHDRLVEVVAQLRERQPELTLRILGASTPSHESYEHELRERIARAGLPAGTIVDPGGRVAELMPALDIFALTSVPRSEGIPTAMLEAMATGVPVLVTDVGSVREVVADGTTGVVVEQDGVAEGLSALAADPVLRARLGAAGRRAAAGFDVDACAATHLQAYRRAVARAGHQVLAP